MHRQFQLTLTKTACLSSFFSEFTFSNSPIKQAPCNIEYICKMYE